MSNAKHSAREGALKKKDVVHRPRIVLSPFAELPVYNEELYTLVYRLFQLHRDNALEHGWVTMTIAFWRNPGGWGGLLLQYLDRYMFELESFLRDMYAYVYKKPYAEDMADFRDNVTRKIPPPLPVINCYVRSSHLQLTQLADLYHQQRCNIKTVVDNRNTMMYRDIVAFITYLWEVNALRRRIRSQWKGTLPSSKIQLMSDGRPMEFHRPI